MNTQKGKKQQVYINGVLYKSLFRAGIETNISTVAIWKSLKKTNGAPVVVRCNFIAMNKWIRARSFLLKREYGI